MFNEKVASTINFNLLDYLISKALLIDSIYNDNNDRGKMLLEYEVSYLLYGSEPDTLPIDTAAGLLVKKLENKDLQKFGEELLLNK
ncbi:hypothetical protein ACOL3H_06645 [Aliarcobacter butzleri]